MAISPISSSLFSHACAVGFPPCWFEIHVHDRTIPRDYLWQQLRMVRETFQAVIGILQLCHIFTPFFFFLVSLDSGELPALLHSSIDIIDDLGNLILASGSAVLC